MAAAIAASRKRRVSDDSCASNQSKDIELVPCNRLDVQTSGLVVLAENKDAARRFQQLLLDGKVYKRYRALVSGTSTNFQVDEKLHHKISDSVFGRPVPRLIASIDSDTDASVHKWRDARATILAVQPRKGLQELEIELDTGRTHQLRAQLAAIGCPVLDDALYKELSGFIWKGNFDDDHAAKLVHNAKTSDAPIGLQCCQLNLITRFHLRPNLGGDRYPIVFRWFQWIPIAEYQWFWVTDSHSTASANIKLQEHHGKVAGHAAASVWLTEPGVKTFGVNDRHESWETMSASCPI